MIIFERLIGVIMMKGFFLIKTVVSIFMIFLVSACSGDQGSDELTDSRLVEISIHPSDAGSLNIPVGASAPFVALGHFSNNTVIDVTSSVQWISSDEQVMSASNGVITGNSIGRGTLSASTMGLISNSLDVNITNAVLTSLQVAPVDLSGLQPLPIGMTTKFIATAIYSDGSTMVAIRGVEWSANDLGIPSMGIVSVSNSGQVTGLKEGITNISARLNDVVSNYVKVEVSSAKITSITISSSGSFQDIPIGVSQEFLALALFSDGVERDVSESVHWKSSAPLIASISEMGLLTANALGSSLVEAEFFDVSSNVLEIHVIPAILTGISISSIHTRSTIPLGSTQVYSAIGHFSDNTSRDITRMASWHSSKVGIISPFQGRIVTLNPGNTSLTAQWRGIVSNESPITVLDATLVSLHLSTDTLDPLPLGLSKKINALGSYSDGSTRNLDDVVHWSSSQTEIAVINDSGYVTGLSIGESLITASLDGIDSSDHLITVTNSILQRISISPVIPLTRGLAVGQSARFVAMGHFSDSSIVDLTRLAMWKDDSINTSISPRLGIAKGISKGEANISASFGKLNSQPLNVQVIDAAVSAIIIIPKVKNTNSTPVGLTLEYRAVAQLTDGTSIDVTNDATWRSSDDNYMTVISGTVTGVKTGSAKLSARWSGIRSQDIDVIITDAVITSLDVNTEILMESLPSGYSIAFIAYGTFSDNSIKNVTNIVDWKSSDTSVAIFVENKALGVGVGITEISASLDEIISESKSLQVTKPVLSSISIQNKKILLPIPQGTSVEFSANGIFSDGTMLDLTHVVKWETDFPSVAEVSPIGVITAITIGIANVKASLDGLNSPSVAIQVVEAIPLSLTIQAQFDAELGIPIGYSGTLVAIAELSNSQQVDVTENAIWSSSSTAAIVEMGVVHGIHIGKAQITASWNNLSSVQDVTITQSILERIIISTPNLNMTIGDVKKFTAMGIYSDGGEYDLTRDVEWISDNPNLGMFIFSPGELIAFGEGQVGIHAKSGTLTSNTLNITITSRPVAIPRLTYDPNFYIGSISNVEANASWEYRYEDDESWRIGNNTNKFNLDLHRIANGDVTVYARALHNGNVSEPTSIFIPGWKLRHHYTPLSGPLAGRTFAYLDKNGNNVSHDVDDRFRYTVLDCLVNLCRDTNDLNNKTIINGVLVKVPSKVEMEMLRNASSNSGFVGAPPEWFGSCIHGENCLDMDAFYWSSTLRIPNYHYYIDMLNDIVAADIDDDGATTRVKSSFMAVEVLQ